MYSNRFVSSKRDVEGFIKSENNLLTMGNFVDQINDLMDQINDLMVIRSDLMNMIRKFSLQPVFLTASHSSTSFSFFSRAYYACFTCRCRIHTQSSKGNNKRVRANQSPQPFLLKPFRFRQHGT